MELKEFVSGTIKQIIDGVIEAQEYAETKGAIVNPEIFIHADDSNNLKMTTTDRGFHSYIQIIDFDVAVTSTEGEQEKAGLGIFVAPITVGAQGKFDYTNTVANRIKFSIPVMLPKR